MEKKFKAQKIELDLDKINISTIMLKVEELRLDNEKLRREQAELATQVTDFSKKTIDDKVKYSRKNKTSAENEIITSSSSSHEVQTNSSTFKETLESTCRDLKKKAEIKNSTTNDDVITLQNVSPPQVPAQADKGGWDAVLGLATMHSTSRRTLLLSFKGTEMENDLSTSPVACRNLNDMGSENTHRTECQDVLASSTPLRRTEFETEKMTENSRRTRDLKKMECLEISEIVAKDTTKNPRNSSFKSLPDEVETLNKDVEACLNSTPVCLIERITLPEDMTLPIFRVLITSSEWKNHSLRINESERREFTILARGKTKDKKLNDLFNLFKLRHNVR